jgi:Protein of unknown function (DUF3738)
MRCVIAREAARLPWDDGIEKVTLAKFDVSIRGGGKAGERFFELGWRILFGGSIFGWEGHSQDWLCCGGITMNRKLIGLSWWKKFVLASAAVAVISAPAIRAQDTTDWQTKAGGKMAFEVASVKLSTGAPEATGFSVGPGDDYQPTGGRFRASTSLRSYIDFAYKLWPSPELRREFSRLPKWMTDDSYTIDAKAAIDNPTKDQMRLMMQSLLAERFQLVVHFEAREVAVFELRLAKAGQLGPKLIPHADGPPCDKPAASPGSGIPGFTVCGNLSAIDAPGGPMGAHAT